MDEDEIIRQVTALTSLRDIHKLELNGSIGPENSMSSFNHQSQDMMLIKRSPSELDIKLEHNQYMDQTQEGMSLQQAQQQQQQQQLAYHHFNSATSSLVAQAAQPVAEATLEDEELWRAFDKETNEMIVTKGGRRMFPILKLSIRNLDPQAMYTIAIEFAQLETHRWKYVSGEWAPGGKAEPSSTQSIYVHPESPHYGAHWMKDCIMFSRAKLTNKPTNQKGQVVLNSLHKYQPKVHVIKLSPANDAKLSPYNRTRVDTFQFPETQFIAVTAYQNENVSIRCVDQLFQLRQQHKPLNCLNLYSSDSFHANRLAQISALNQTNILRHTSGHKAQDQTQPVCEGLPGRP